MKVKKNQFLLNFVFFSVLNISEYKKIVLNCFKKTMVKKILYIPKVLEFKKI